MALHRLAVLGQSCDRRAILCRGIAISGKTTQRLGHPMHYDAMATHRLESRCNSKESVALRSNGKVMRSSASRSKGVAIHFRSMQRHVLAARGNAKAQLGGARHGNGIADQRPTTRRHGQRPSTTQRHGGDSQCEAKAQHRIGAPCAARAERSEVCMSEQCKGSAGLRAAKELRSHPEQWQGEALRIPAKARHSGTWQRHGEAYPS